MEVGTGIRKACRIGRKRHQERVPDVDFVADAVHALEDGDVCTDHAGARHRDIGLVVERRAYRWRRRLLACHPKRGRGLFGGRIGC